MAAVSNKKRKQVKEALSQAAYDMLCDLAPESLDHAPESWEPETRRVFDLLNMRKIELWLMKPA